MNKNKYDSNELYKLFKESGKNNGWLEAIGDDTVKNAIALCPNCHRELHFGVVTQNYS